jgi:hypothetical protein
MDWDSVRKKQHKEYELWSSQKIDYIVPRYPKKKLSASAVKWLKQNKVAQKYINSKVIEYYHSGQIKCVDVFVGGYDDIDMVHLDFIDYDEEGKMQVFKTKKARLSWVIGKDNEYRMQMDEEELHECRGIIFPEKKPTTKTGSHTFTEQDELIIKDLVPLFAGDLFDLGIKKMDYYEDIGDKYGLSSEAIRKKASKFRIHIERLVEAHNK